MSHKNCFNCRCLQISTTDLATTRLNQDIPVNIKCKSKEQRKANDNLPWPDYKVNQVWLLEHCNSFEPKP